MNTQIIQEIVDFLKSFPNGEAPTSDVKAHLSNLHPGLQYDEMDYIIAEGDKEGYFHRRTMMVNGIINDVIYLPRVEQMAPNKNKTKMEDLIEKYKTPVKLPGDKK